MHNKPKMQPLDSRTLSGKMVDEIIKELVPTSIKTNLFEEEYLPERKEIIWASNLYWNKKYKPTADDVIVLLGKWVQENFLLTAAKIIKLSHPASCMGYGKKKDWIYDAVLQISDAMNS